MDHDLPHRRRRRVVSALALACAVIAPSVVALAAPTASAASTATASPARHVLLKQLFANFPDDNTVDAPQLSALCQSYLGKPNPYNPVSPNVDVIQGDTTVPVGSQTGCQTAQNETTTATNPWNPRNLVAGANDYRLFNTRENRNDSSSYAYTTSDGGRTWADEQIPKLTFASSAVAPLSYMDGAGDPSVAFGGDNTVYYASLVFSRVQPADGSQSASGITVSTSHDGGHTWGDPTILHLDGVLPDGTPTPASIFNDKEWITTDPFTGDVYVTWTQFTYDASGNYLESPIVESHSADHGKTWSAPTRVSPSLTGFTGGITPFGSGSNPQIGNDGTLYVAYETSICKTTACNDPADHDAVVLATSRDHGKTFKTSIVGRDYDFPVNADIGTAVLTGENFRLNSFPQLAYDRFTGKLWTTWTDDRNGQYDAQGNSIKTNGAAFVSSSFNGRDWAPVQQAGPGGDQFYSAIAAVAGRVAVTYYTRSYDPTGIGLDYAYVVGWDSAVAHGVQQRITTQTSNPQVQFIAIGSQTGTVYQGAFIGDYSAATMGLDFNLHPVWTDFRGNPALNTPNQDVYTQSIPTLR